MQVKSYTYVCLPIDYLIWCGFKRIYTYTLNVDNTYCMRMCVDCVYAGVWVGVVYVGVCMVCDVCVVWVGFGFGCVFVRDVYLCAYVCVYECGSVAMYVCISVCVNICIGMRVYVGVGMCVYGCVCGVCAWVFL